MPYKPPSKALGGLDYTKCKRSELDSFYKTRAGKPIPDAVENKTHLIRLLREVDKVPGVFRFFDLPVELRNAIYSEVLAAGESICKASILRVSKMVHGEARGILYDRIEIKMELEIHHFLFAEPCLRRNITPLDRQSQLDWFQRLSTFTHVHVKINLQPTVSIQGDAKQLMKIANHELYSLCSFLIPSSTLKTLEIEVTTPETINNVPFDDLGGQIALKEVLWPVNILPSKVQIKLYGAAATIDKSFSSTRELELPHLSDILRQLRTLRILISNLEELVGNLEAAWTAGLRPLHSLETTLKAYLNITGLVVAAEHRGMQGCLKQAEEILPVAIDTLMEIANKRKVQIRNKGSRGGQTRLEIHRLNLVRVKREVAILLGQSVHAA